RAPQRRCGDPPLRDGGRRPGAVGAGRRRPHGHARPRAPGDRHRRAASRGAGGRSGGSAAAHPGGEVALRGPGDWLRPCVRGVAAYVPGEQPEPGRRVIKLNTNENPYPPSPRVLEALARAIDGSLRLYPDPEARALRARAAAVYGVPVDHILAGNGSDELIALLLRAVVDPGDRVAFPVPTYSLYETLVAAHGAEAEARLTFLCNPNSPSGTLVPVSEVARLAERIAGLLVVDEAYVDFAREHALGLVGRCPNVVVLQTLSKSFSLAGLRVGLLFGPPGLLAGLRVVKD